MKERDACVKESSHCALACTVDVLNNKVHSLNIEKTNVWVVHVWDHLFV